MRFRTIGSRETVPTTGKNIGYLKIDLWNDFSFVTMFQLYIFDDTGTRHDLGNVKIGFVGQTEADATYSAIKDFSGNELFETLPDHFFSLGEDDSYYSIISNELPEGLKDSILTSLKDVVYVESQLKLASIEKVFRTSLLRSVSITTVERQYKNILNGFAPLTDYFFKYSRTKDSKYSGVNLDFRVYANSKPSTNIHAIIGRNGIGKTTILNDMIDAIVRQDIAQGKFYEWTYGQEEEISRKYFSGVISISFSAFDPFSPPQEQTDPTLGACYSYVGLKDPNDDQGHTHKTILQLHEEFVSNFNACMSSKSRTNRWLRAIKSLESDENFAAMNLAALIELDKDKRTKEAIKLISLMSSGHAIVLLIMTKLVSRVEEQTLVLIDEPESHLHPPLLSAFTRALSDLLHQRNGVAIIATHSPVVLQEVPKSCVWIVTRSRLALSTARPEIETFGENVGVLTREVFGLEIAKSGYHTLLAADTASGSSYQAIIDSYNGQLGFEAKAVLSAMITDRDM